MEANSTSETFSQEWSDLAKLVVQRISLDSEILVMKEDFIQNKSLSLEQRSRFIAIANRIKNQVIHELYGNDGTEGYTRFAERWQDWFNSKGVVSNSQFGKRLTNEEHIIYSSTPEAEEFFRNMET